MSNAIAEITAGPILANGARRRVSRFDKAITVKTIGPKDDYSLGLTDPIPGTGVMLSTGSWWEGKRYAQGTAAPIFASQIQVGDIIAVRQTRQSAYNSPNMAITTHSKAYEVVAVGTDDAGLFFKLSQPGKIKKGKGGTKWRGQDLDSVHGIVRP
jgi:hypothetical protein